MFYNNAQGAWMLERDEASEPVTHIMDDWGLRYPGIKRVEHVYFYNVTTADDTTRKQYLERAYELGKEFACS